MEGIGAAKFTGPCMSKIDQLLASDQWNYKHAGLVALCQVMEALKKKKVQTVQIVKKLKNFIQGNFSILTRMRFAICFHYLWKRIFFNLYICKLSK